MQLQLDFWKGLRYNVQSWNLIFEIFDFLNWKNVEFKRRSVSQSPHRSYQNYTQFGKKLACKKNRFSAINCWKLWIIYNTYNFFVIFHFSILNDLLATEKKANELKYQSDENAKVKFRIVFFLHIYYFTAYIVRLSHTKNALTKNITSRLEWHKSGRLSNVLRESSA